jgi:hypothetical protein
MSTKVDCPNPGPSTAPELRNGGLDVRWQRGLVVYSISGNPRYLFDEVESRPSLMPGRFGSDWIRAAATSASR